ncbi:bifunctional endoribonuclease/protein kinase IRE1 KNAG_0B04500 [Huiozyma naganishii CBS 8797]|uniref:non-specific serine/threonine protein kinase n=1 Tax=Huiozyma naganishii (strain ATCC MYA-139 / BCRC 22969 / CBS 8797 / KCTC 17520 / NBRC 10181 / NCYC 3082 / Yp74L-3) TaxID=1071383 RepID=J7S3S8_HUIN7|nr:hypothetical protein KNAG_0B04500 [Kazachstania naganishii CBS 8797]CCK68884.1 hypothetical protein KNAG_0B04500 [Kazachstania naganishii CBS 8797]
MRVLLKVIFFLGLLQFAPDGLQHFCVGSKVIENNKYRKHSNNASAKQYTVESISNIKELGSTLNEKSTQRISPLATGKQYPVDLHRRKGSSPALPASYLIGRSIADLNLSPILIVCDIEGGLHAINRDDGQIIWSIDSSEFQPLIQIEQPPSIETKETLLLEPSGDGTLYFFHAHQGLQKIPGSINQLIATSPVHMRAELVVDDLGTTIEDEKIYTGSRTSMMYVIDMSNGALLSSFGNGSRKHKRGATSDSEEDSCMNELTKTLMIGKSIYKLQINSQNGSIYNVTYCTWQPNSLDVHLSRENVVSKDGLFVAPFRDKSLLGVDGNFKIAKWVSPEFPGIIVSVFDLFVDKHSNETVLVSHPFHNLEEADSEQEKIYLEQTKSKTWAAFSSKHFPSLVKAAPISKYVSSSRWRTQSIFSDESLFRTAITGVHVVDSAPIQSIPYNRIPEASHRPALMLDPVPYQPISLEHGHNAPLDQKNNALRESIQMAQTEAFPRSAKISALYAIGSFFYRIIESGLILVFSLVVLLTLQKYEIIPPMHIMMEKVGLAPRQDVAPPVFKEHISTNTNVEKGSDSENKVSDLQMHPIPSNEVKKAVIFEEPEQNLKMFSLDNDSNATLRDNGEQFTEKKKRKRGSRGGKKSKTKSHSIDGVDTDDSIKSLVVSDKILGYGSSGTVVFEGSFQNRRVAVKRMLLDFCDLADREIRLLTESDDHPNVIRYYCSEMTEKFLYIALELCDANLEDLVATKLPSSKIMKFRKNLDLVDLLCQIGSGIAHLHSLKIIHRDIKPQNILVSENRIASIATSSTKENLRILISDFGLCKKLDNDQSSFRTNMQNPAGTTGWRAPELLDGSSFSILENMDTSKHGESTTDTSIVSTDSFYDPFTKQRLTRAVDIFSMGCVFFYVLTNGQHPFGSKYMREGNIIKGEYDLSPLRTTIKEKWVVEEATNLISRLIARDPKQRPTAMTVLKHPLFWPIQKKLAFLLKFSDRFELKNKESPNELLGKLDTLSKTVIPKADWSLKFDKLFMDNLGKYRKYHFDRVLDLLRAFRNKYHHYMDMPEELADIMGTIPDGFYHFFIVRFPNLLMETYLFVEKNMADDQAMVEFF